MSSELDQVVARAHQLVKEKKRGDAMSLANQAVEEYRDEMEAWLLRGYLHELSQDYVNAADDLTRAIELNSKEPHLYYTLGRYHFQLRNINAAIEDFSKALDLCDFYKNDYYRDELFFWRAEALLRLGNKNAALKDLENLRDDFTSWTYALRTKRDLITDCQQ
jgi:tetratricopeptide (TPR) repeat protein